MAKPILSLDVLTERHHVAINGTPYQLRNVGELGLVDYHRLDRMTVRVDAAMRAMRDGEPTEDQAAELDTVLDEAVALVLDAPPEVRRILPFPHKVRILETFSLLQRGEAPTARSSTPAPESSRPARRRRGEPTATPPTGASGSHA